MHYYLLQMPPALMLFTLLGLLVLGSSLATFVFRRHKLWSNLQADNRGVAEVFGLVGGLYGLLLGFVVLLVWDSYNEAHVNANREGSIARGLYRSIRYHPDSMGVAPLLKDYLTYIRHVTHHEYPHMETLQAFSAEDRLAFNNLFRQLEGLGIDDYRSQEMFRYLNELSTYRNLRQLDASGGIPGAIWLALITGGLGVILLALLLKIHSLRLHMLVNSILSCCIGLIIYIIIILDHPFSGSLKIQPESYQQILIMAAEDQ